MRRLLPAATVLLALALLLLLVSVWAARLPYPHDLEWMEGGMLAHAWRLQRGLPLYVPPNPDFVPYVYPPGYPALVAALGSVFGLSLPLGRLVSLLSVFAAAGALAFAVRRHGGGAVLALGTAVAFLGTYPFSGAFYDLVRPDALHVALLAWSLVLGLEQRPGAPVASGLLLAASFLVKQSAGVFGPAMLLGLWARGGWRPALSFAAAAAGPALAFTGWMQWRTGGHYLTWLVDVPASHPQDIERAFPLTPRELGTPLPVVFGVLGLHLVLDLPRRVRSVPVPVLLFTTVGAGMLLGWWGSYLPGPEPGSGAWTFPSSFAFFALGAVTAVALLRMVGGLLDAVRLRAARPLSWRWVYGMGVGATAVGMAALMRAHEGGFLNVHVPAFLVACLGFGLALARWPRPLALGAVCLQLLWGMALLDRDRLRPSEASWEAGERLVARMREVDGPVLSPFAAWLPTYAGKPPSLHYMGLWDLEHEGGPYVDELGAIRRAVRDQRWSLVLIGDARFPYALDRSYEVAEEVVPEDSPALRPRTGWRARPMRVLRPRRAGSAAPRPAAPPPSPAPGGGRTPSEP